MRETRYAKPLGQLNATSFFPLSPRSTRSKSLLMLFRFASPLENLHAEKYFEKGSLQ